MFTSGDFLLNLFVFIYGLLWALTMVNAEGANGWGGASPAWKLDNKKWYAILFWPFAQGRSINFLPVFAIMAFTLSFFLPILWNFSQGLPFTWANLGELLTYFIIFAILEDFIWFLINPAFGLKKFNKQFIPWHPRWLGFLPTDYWAAFLFVILMGFLSRGPVWLGITISIQLLLTFFVMLISKKIIR